MAATTLIFCSSSVIHPQLKQEVSHSGVAKVSTVRDGYFFWKPEFFRPVTTLSSPKRFFSTVKIFFPQIVFPLSKSLSIAEILPPPKSSDQGKPPLSPPCYATGFSNMMLLTVTSECLVR